MDRGSGRGMGGGMPGGVEVGIGDCLVEGSLDEEEDEDEDEEGNLVGEGVFFSFGDPEVITVGSSPTTLLKVGEGFCSLVIGGGELKETLDTLSCKR
ncbi:hypothetical protein L6452_18167 [Arctium lappa]|uniref:Uncharacterized protein n=1 Tax=Arctium lappa TaxID=4217 RepID=A0ACB9C5P9_ARCLA|nr:hypothetical protein L6452_18167 [Arctium lappa]